MCFNFALNGCFHVRMSVFLLRRSSEMLPNLNLPICSWPPVVLCCLDSLLCLTTSCVSAVCVFTSPQNNCSWKYSSERMLRGECATWPSVFLCKVHHFYSPPSQSACLTKSRPETTLFVIYLFFLYSIILLVKSTVSFCHFTSFPHLYSSPILFLSSLSRSCKLQIRNIPPHMQWEVSANRLLTASRVAHYRDSWPGSCSGVSSHLPLPSFGFLLWGAWWFASERGDSGSAPRTEEQMELRLEEHKLLQDRSVGQNWWDLWQNWGNWDVWSSFRKHRGPYEIFNFCEWRKTRPLWVYVVCMRSFAKSCC